MLKKKINIINKMASKQELMDLPVELLQLMITYIPSKDLLNLSSIRNR